MYHIVHFANPGGQYYGVVRVSEERLEEMEMRDLEGGPPMEFGNEDDEGVTA